MIQVNIFADGSTDSMDTYTAVEQAANTWLKEHPDAKVIASHTNMAATDDWTEFAITLIVELPAANSQEPDEDGRICR